MAYQHALVQLLLLDELLYILGHNTISVHGGMERKTMVPQILVIVSVFIDHRSCILISMSGLENLPK